MKLLFRAIKPVKKYFSLLFLLFLFAGAQAQQTFRDYPYWSHPVIKKLEQHQPGVLAFTRDGSNLVNLCIADTSAGIAYFISQYGFVFDTLHLVAADEKEIRLDIKKANPFHWYETRITQYLPVLEEAKKFLRENGNDFKRASSIQQKVLTLSAVKQASSTLAKLLAIEEYERESRGVLLHFNWCIHCPEDSSVQHRVQEGKKPGSLIIQGNLDSGYSEFINKDILSGIRKARLEHRTGMISYYDWRNQVVDSFLIKKSKVSLLVQEKADVFVLYRTWLEWDLQNLNASIPAWQYVSNYSFLKSERSFEYAGFIHKKSSTTTLLNLKKERKKVLATIKLLAGPDEVLFSTLIAYPRYKPFQKETRQWNSLTGTWTVSSSFTRGQKHYELTDHRGNVMATVSDRKTGIDLNSDGVIDNYEADITTATDYYPGGMLMPGRKYGTLERYGFNGKEQDPELGEGTQYDYGFRIYDPRLVRFKSVDPIAKDYPFYTPYQFAGNKLISCIDLDGLEEKWKVTTNFHLDYYPVFKTPDVSTGVNNAVGNGMKFTWNITFGAVLGAGKSVWNWGVDQFSGNPEPPPDPVNSLNLWWEDEKDYFKETPRKQIWKDFKEEVTNLNNYELPAQLLLLHKFSKPGLSNLEVAAKQGIEITEKINARINLAKNFYAEQGYSPEKVLRHIDGIDFGKPVQPVTLTKGTVIQQWVGENGVGDYFTSLENGAAHNLGMPGGYEGRTLKQFTLTKDTKVLKSTASKYQGQAGGGVQYFSAELRSRITENK